MDFRFIFLKPHHHIHFFVPPVQVSCLGCNYCIWNRLKALKTRLSFFRKNGIRIPIRIISFSQWSNIVENGTVIINGNSRFRRQSEMCKLWEGNKYSFPIGINNICAYVLLSIYTPFPCTHTSWKDYDLLWCIFPISSKFGHHKIFQGYHIFYSFCAKSYPHQKKARSYGTAWKFRNWFYYQFEQIFQNSYQYFQSCTASFEKFQHTVKQVQDTPLQCHYTRHIVWHVSIAT